MTERSNDLQEADPLADEALDRYWDSRFTFSGSM